MRSVCTHRPSFFRAARTLLGLGLVVLGLSACATKPPASEPAALADYNKTNDPLEPTNRVFYAVNNGLDTVLLRPLALAYHYGVPDPVQDGVHNVLSNIGSPVRLANDMLEGKPRRAGDTTMRFLINTSVGVLGIFDVATGWGYPEHDADFGMTLALWGVPEGPYLYLPVLGPSDPRDALGFGVDLALDPLTWVGPSNSTGWTAFTWSRFGLSAIDARSRVLDALDAINKTALDPYATLRSLYRQHRRSEIEKLRHANQPELPDEGGSVRVGGER